MPGHNVGMAEWDWLLANEYGRDKILRVRLVGELQTELGTAEPAAERGAAVEAGVGAGS